MLVAKQEKSALGDSNWLMKTFQVLVLSYYALKCIQGRYEFKEKI